MKTCIGAELDDPVRHDADLRVVGASKGEDEAPREIDLGTHIVTVRIAGAGVIPGNGCCSARGGRPAKGVTAVGVGLGMGRSGQQTCRRQKEAEDSLQCLLHGYHSFIAAWLTLEWRRNARRVAAFLDRRFELPLDDTGRPLHCRCRDDAGNA